QWEIVFREESNLVEVRDTAHILQYTSKQPFRIVPQSRSGSTLVKSAELRGAASAVADTGDRELRGSLEVVPTPYGFVLINDLPLEDYLYGAVSAAMPPGTPAEAYKAQAVVSRTRAMWAKAHPIGGPFPHDLCDAARDQRYIGLNSEPAAAVQAVAATEGAYLRHLNGALAEVRQHAHCGGVTEPGQDSLAHLRPVSDGPGPGPRLDSPESLERWIHASPSPDRYCDQGGLTPPVEARWARLLDARDVTRRARRLREIGKVRHLRVLRRSSSGRIQSIEVVGSADTLLLNGPEAIEAVLSPRSLRSTLFTIQPLYSGRSPTHFLLWGGGTGHGLGMCAAGAIGQASVGRKHHDILSHYFPGLVLWSPKAKETMPGAAPFKKRKPRR
ncbi:MAG: SpoIID/LytB domain-containing protein, partial [Elusimicrobiota bacterium]